MKQKKGITLISLVITIVVLLILAGVAISIAVSPDNIFEKAEEAKTKWKNAVDDEEIKVNNALGYLENAPVALPAGWDSTKISNVFTETSTIYEEEKERKVPIPKGFVVSGITSEMNPEHPENTIAGGLVIYQKGNDETIDWEANTITKEGEAPANLQETANQYVWIPVDNIDSMVMCKRNGQSTKLDGTAVEGEPICTIELQGNELVCTTHGYSTATELTAANIDTTGLAGRLYGVSQQPTLEDSRIYQAKMTFTNKSQTFSANSGYREPAIVSYYDKDDATSGNNYMELAGIGNKTVATFKSELNSDFIEMAKSVAKFGGFYVSRYEAGESGASKKNQIVLTALAPTSSSYPNALAGNRWYGLYNTLRNGTGVDTNVVESHMIWRKPVGPNYKLYRSRSTSWTPLSNY